MGKYEQNIGYNEAAKLIFNFIKEEPFLNEEKLIIKIKTILKSTSLNLSIYNYHKTKTPSKSAEILFKMEITNKVKNYYKNELKKIIGEERIKLHYKKIDEYEANPSKEL